MHLAADPGRRAGWAAMFEHRAGGRTIRRGTQSGVINGSNLVEVSRIVERYAHLGTLVIEDQIYGKVTNKKTGEKNNMPWPALCTLLRYRHYWEVVAEQHEMKVVPVKPQTWQSHFKIKRGDKDAIVRVARALTCRDVDYDEADAVLEAYWYEHYKKLIGGEV
jgi:hypothetical protein